MNMNDVKMFSLAKRLDTLTKSLQEEAESLIRVIENQETKKVA